jgi:pyrroloquinoline quinone biosynthesis protein D
MGSSVPKLSAADRPRLAADCRLCYDDGRSSGWLMRGNSDDLRLNDTATEILARCNGERSVERLVSEMVELYAGTDECEIARGVRGFLDEALLRGWIDRSADLG